MVAKRNDLQEQSLSSEEMDAQLSQPSRFRGDKLGTITQPTSTAQEPTIWTFEGVCRFVGGWIAGVFSW